MSTDTHTQAITRCMHDAYHTHTYMHVFKCIHAQVSCPHHGHIETDRQKEELSEEKKSRSSFFTPTLAETRPSLSLQLSNRESNVERYKYVHEFCSIPYNRWTTTRVRTLSVCMLIRAACALYIQREFLCVPCCQQRQSWTDM